jgi:hypothetical protein
VERILLTFQSRLTLARPAGELDVILQTTGRLTTPDGQARTFDPGSPGTLGPVTALLRRTVTEITLGADGTLKLRLDDDSLITLPPHPDHEAWEMVESTVSGLLIVCTPGGDVAVFDR